jgi:nitroreductase
MTHEAEHTFQVEELIHERFSPVAFATRPIERWKLGSLLEAARWAASSFTEQPWAFMIAEREPGAAYARALSCLVEGNVVWAQHAPLLRLSGAKLHFERNGKPNRHAAYDTGQAVANMAIQATALDLYLHQMAGYSVDRAREVFAIPDDWEPMAMIAVGYHGNVDALPEQQRRREKAPRTRKPLVEFVFTERWGKSPLLLSEADQS